MKNRVYNQHVLLLESFCFFLAAVIVYLAMYSKSNEKVNYVQNRKTPTTQSLAFRAPSFWVDTKQEMDMTKYLQRDGIEEKRCCVDM